MSLSTVKCGWWNFRMMTLIFGPTGFGTYVEKVKHGGRENGWISKPERTVNLLKKERGFWLPAVWEWGNSLATTSGKDVELHHILSFSFVKSHSWRQSYYQHIFQGCQPDLWLLSVSKWGKGSLRPVRSLNAEIITCTKLILAPLWFRIVALLTFGCSVQSCKVFCSTHVLLVA